MQTDAEKMIDADVIRLAEAELDAGIPDIQTAEASAAAKQRTRDDGEPEAHPS